MEDLALAIDKQNAENLMRPSALATMERRQEQPTEAIPFTETLGPPSVQSVLPVENSEDNNSDTGISQLSLRDEIGRRIPDDSELARSLEYRTSLCKVVGHDGTEIVLREFYIAEVRNRLSGKGVLVIEIVSIDTGEDLCAAYPAVLHPELMADHIIRFDEFPAVPRGGAGVEWRPVSCYPDAGFEVQIWHDFMVIQTGGVNRQQRLENSYFHLGFIIEDPRRPISSPFHLQDFIVNHKNTNHRLQDVLQKDELNRWRRVSVRVSCFQLEGDFCKIECIKRFR